MTTTKPRAKCPSKSIEHQSKEKTEASVAKTINTDIVSQMLELDSGSLRKVFDAAIGKWRKELERVDTERNAGIERIENRKTHNQKSIEDLQDKINILKEVELQLDAESNRILEWHALQHNNLEEHRSKIEVLQSAFREKLIGFE